MMKSRSDFTKECLKRRLCVRWSSIKGNKHEEVAPEDFIELENMTTVGMDENKIVRRTSDAVNELLQMEQAQSHAADAAVTRKPT